MSTCELNALHPHLNAARSWREFHGIRQQIPDDLLEAIAIAGDRPHARVDDCLDANALGVGSGLDRRYGIVDDERQLDWLNV